MGSARALYNSRRAILNSNFLIALGTRLNNFRKTTFISEKIYDDKANLKELKILTIGTIRSERFLKLIISDY